MFIFHSRENINNYQIIFNEPSFLETYTARRGHGMELMKSVKRLVIGCWKIKRGNDIFGLELVRSDKCAANFFSSRSNIETLNGYVSCNHPAGATEVEITYLKAVVFQIKFL